MVDCDWFKPAHEEAGEPGNKGWLRHLINLYLKHDRYHLLRF